MTEHETDAARRLREVWFPATLSLLAIALFAFLDWYAHDTTWPLNLDATAQHPKWIRTGIHGISALMLVCAVFRRRSLSRRIRLVGAVVVLLNALATTRLVVTEGGWVRVVIVGDLTLHTVQNLDRWSEGEWVRQCIRHFSHSWPSIQINDQSITPPFLPLPVEWEDVERMVNGEAGCPNGIPRRGDSLTTW